MELEKKTVPNTVKIPDKIFFRIGDVAELIGVKPYVLRYWETEFPIVAPQKSDSGQRIYRKTDVESLLLIKHLLYNERYSIEGARKRIRELKRGGEFKDYKREKILGGTATVQRRENLEQMLKLAKQIQSTLRRTV